MRLMDLLAKRYASPFFILDEFIRLGQLHDFIIEFLHIVKEEKTEQLRWEFFLHKVHDKSYVDYMATFDEEETITNEEIKNVCDESRNILDSFSF